MQKENGCRNGFEGKKTRTSFPRVVIGNLHRFVKTIRRRSPSPADGGIGDDNYLKAFTLIELLVVVLIIGILAAVALPQYQVAIAKSRLAAVKPKLTAIKEAEEVYYLANGSYTGDQSNLAVSVADIPNSNGKFNEYFYINFLGSAVENAYVIVWYCPQADSADGTACALKAEFVYTVWFEHSAYPNKVTCAGYTNLGKKVCKNP